MKKNIPLNHHPLFNDDEDTLDFGPLDVKVLTDEQKADSFLSKYLSKVDPFEKYKKYFETSAKSNDHIMRDIKLYYKKLVLEGSWSERKYVMVVNDILENRIVLTVITLDRSGMMYEKGLLASQRRIKDTENRKR